MCYASFCLPSPSLGTEQKEARPQGLIRKFFIEYPDVVVFILLIKQILNYQIAQDIIYWLQPLCENSLFICSAFGWGFYSPLRR